MFMLCTMLVAAGGPAIHLFIRLEFCVSTIRILLLFPFPRRHYVFVHDRYYNNILYY